MKRRLCDPVDVTGFEPIPPFGVDRLNQCKARHPVYGRCIHGHNHPGTSHATGYKPSGRRQGPMVFWLETGETVTWE